MKVADALDTRLEELLAPVRTLTAVRFRAEKKMTTRGELLADVARWLDDYSELEALVGAKQKFAFSGVRKKVDGVPAGEERARRAAEFARAAVKLTDRDVIRDICGMLEDHGAKVFTPKLASEGFFGLSIAARDGGPAVVVNVWERLSVERWIFTAAHELGHLILHLDAYDVSKTEEDAMQEKEADTRNLVATNTMSEEKATRLRAVMERAFPDAEVTGFEHLIASMRNDAKDRHVVAAAVRAGAQVITTSNVRDFAPLPDGLEAQSPDELLANLFDLDPDALVDILREQAADLQRPPVSVGDLLARLVLVAPNFVAAVRAHIGGPP